MQKNNENFRRINKKEVKPSFQLVEKVCFFRKVLFAVQIKTLCVGTFCLTLFDCLYTSVTEAVSVITDGVGYFCSKYAVFAGFVDFFCIKVHY